MASIYFAQTNNNKRVISIIMNNNQLENEIIKIKDEAIEMFEKTSDRLFLERVEKEHNLAKQYNGREILELLQNIDDAYNAKCGNPCEASFELKEDCLIVSNYGNPFTLGTLQRLCQGSVSSKEGKYIGCKGIGFRSVLNWSKKIEIYSQSENSAYIAVRFSKTYADNVFESIKSNTHIQSQITELERKKINPSFPIFKAPEPIEPDESIKYNTVIKIFIEKDIKEEIQNKIQQFDRNILLFLPNVQKLIFKYNNNEITYSKERSSDNKIALKSNDQNEEIFYYYEDNNQTIDGNINGTNSIRMAIAIPTEETEKEYNLYTFFPILNIKSPFNALLHATFSLNANRNNFEPSNEDDKINKAIFLKLLEFYISKIENLDLKERRLQLLSPKKFGIGYSFPDDLARLNCVNDFIKLCQDKKILYSINNEYLKPTEKNPPIINNSKIPQVFKENSSIFSRIVIVNEKEKLFAEQLTRPNTKVMTEEYLHSAINNCSNTWESNDRIKVLKWWNDNKYTKLPNLIKNSKKEFICSSETSCFLSGSITDLPEWANINIIYGDDEYNLLKEYEIEINESQQNKNENKKRILPRLINNSLMNLQEQSSRQVMISPVNNSVGNDYLKAIEYTEWLWNVWKQEEKFESTIKTNVKFIVPTANKSVRFAEETYMGSEFYENSLGDSLFSQLGFEKVFIPDFTDDKEKFIRFLLDIGVCKWPKISSIIIENQNQVFDYIEYIKTKHLFEYKDVISYWNISVEANPNIDNILEGATTITILKWILSDSQLKSLIILDEEPNSSYAEYKPRIQGRKYCERWNKGWNLPSYLRYLFSCKEWIEIKGNKYAPSKLIISSDSYLEKFGYVCMTEEHIEKMADKLGLTSEELKQLLLNLGIKESYIDLKSKQFYQLLLKLGENNDETSKKISREIYRSIINNYRGAKEIKTQFYAESEEKNKFFESGKVLAKNQSGDVKYVSIKEVYFSSSAVLNLDDNYFIDIPPRSGNKEKFKEILGVKSFSQEYEIVRDSIKISSIDKEFQSDLKDYLPYLLTYRTGNKNSISFDIRLVSEIDITINGEKQKIVNSYALIKESKSKWYIYVGNIISNYNNIDKCKTAEALEQIFNVYFNFPAKDFLNQVGRLFICNPEQRRYFVESDFGSIYEYNTTLEDLSISHEVKQNIKNNIVGIQNNDKLSSLVEEIDWMDLDNASVQEKIVKLLTETGKTIEDLSKILDREVSITTHNKNSLWDLYCMKEDFVKSAIYSHCEKNKKYKTLLKHWDGFELKVKKINSNDLSFNAKEYLQQLFSELKTNYQIEIDSQNGKMKEIRKRYDENKEKLIKEFQEKRLNLNDFTNKEENHSLLYFEEEIWREEVNAFINKCNEDDKKNNKDYNEAINLDTMFEKITFSNDLETGKVRASHSSSNRTYGGAVTERNSDAKNKVNKKQGNLAEYLVVLALAKKEIKEVNSFFNGNEYSIIWKSGAANEISRAEGDNYEYDKSQVDDGIGYDIELIDVDNHNKKMCIEVKSSTSDNCSFFMSENEYRVSQEIEDNKGVYRIIFVSNIDSDKTSISFIDGSVKKAFDAIPTQYNVIYNKEKLNKDQQSRK